jgi:hypothetical protein
MQKELKIKLLPNNQVSLFTQWVTRKSEERFLVRPDYSKEPEHIKEYYRSGQAKFEREKKKTHETIRVPYYKADGSLKLRLLRREKSPDAVKDSTHYWHFVTRTLDITKKSQRSPKSHRGWGMKNTPKRYTNRSGQKVREVGAMMDNSCWLTTEQASCTTLTLPANTPESFDVLARYSGYIINRLFQIIRRQHPVEPKWFFVWEFQKRGALHLHIAHYAEDPTDSQLTGALLIDQWHKILIDVSQLSQCCLFTAREGDRCTVRQFHQHHTQPMYKSCGAYFSKYASKSENSKEGSYISFFSKKYPPSRFWGSSMALKRMCRENSYEEILAIGEGIEEKHQDILSLILLHNPVKYSEYEWRKKLNEGTEKEVVISEGKCEVFYLPKEQYSEFLIMLSSAS